MIGYELPYDRHANDETSLYQSKHPDTLINNFPMRFALIILANILHVRDHYTGGMLPNTSLKYLPSNEAHI